MENESERGGPIGGGPGTRADQANAVNFLALHGFTGDGADFSALSRYVGGEWHCPDLPGHGENAEAPPDQFRLENLTSTLLADRKKPLSGLGYSMGGRILLHLALRRPEAFSRLILIGSSPGLRTDEERRDRIESDEQWIQKLHSAPLGEFIKEWWSQPVMEGLHTLQEGEKESLFARRLRNDPVGLAKSLRHHGTGALPSLWDRLEEIKIPVLMMVGEHDQKFRSIAEEMKNLLPRSSLAIIPASGHSPHMENPEATSRAISLPHAKL